MATIDNNKAILSIDGGGIRGLIPAIILTELTKRLAARGKTDPLHKYFDLIAGTSTGGIIAAGLAAPAPGQPSDPAMTPEGLRDLYLKDGPTIFARERFRSLREAFRDFNYKAVVQEKYDADPLEDLLDQYLGNATLHDALTNVLITAYDIRNRSSLYLRGGPDLNALSPENYYFYAAARSTSAAPTYFEPEPVTAIGSQVSRVLVDGGVFANQPAMCAYSQACKLGWDPSKLEMLSLGTGYQTRQFKFDEAKDWGPINWINPAKGAPILSILMHGQADSTDWQMQQIMGTRFTRLDANLSHGNVNDDLDDASKRNLRNLSNFAQHVIQANSQQLDDWAVRLT